MPPTLWLASTSARRRALLRAAGLRARGLRVRVDERPRRGEAPEAYVERLALAKALAAAALLPARAAACVLAADTVVALDRRLLGKPRDRAHARRMLGALSGRVHDVWTGLCLWRGPAGSTHTAVERTRVQFRELAEPWIAWYLASGEGADKAGAYGIQGRGALLCKAIQGSWSNVVGLPLERLPELFRAAGLDLLAYLRPRPLRKPRPR